VRNWHKNKHLKLTCSRLALVVHQLRSPTVQYYVCNIDQPCCILSAQFQDRKSTRQWSGL